MPHSAPSARVRGFYGVAVWKPKTEANVGSLWRTSATYRADFMAVVGGRYTRQASDTTFAPASTPFYEYDDLDALIGNLPRGCQLIGVEQSDRSVPIDRWTHPERALYLMGAEDHGLTPEVLARCHQVIEVPCPEPWSINVAAAGSHVVISRYLQHRARKAFLGVAS